MCKQPGNPHRAAGMILLILLNTICLSDQLSADDNVLFDFDNDRKLSTDWSAVGKIKAKRQAGPKGKDASDSGPSGNAVTLETEGKAGLFAKSGTVSRNWEEFSHVSFWVHRAAAEAELRSESVMEIQIYEEDQKARFWRKVTLDHEGWKEFRLPLKWFRWGGNKRTRWDRIGRMGFWFRDAASVSIDDIGVHDTKSAKAAYLSLEELSAVAFPDNGRVTETKDLAVLSNAAAVDRDKLAAHLSHILRTLRADHPWLPEPVRKPMLIVFADQQEYERFPTVFAARFNSEAAPPKSTGFTFHGIATSYPDPDNPTLRPTFTHEFLHSCLTQTLRISNRGDWLQEGVASMYQLHFHPQANIPKIVRDGVEQERSRTPLAELCNGERIPMTRYWQAATVVQLLTTDPYKDRFPELIAAIQNSKTTDLGPHLDSILKTDWETLTDDWLEFCKSRYVFEVSE